jgi:hypothetical protein
MVRTVQVAVTDGAGGAVAGATVFAVTDGGPCRRVLTDAGGRASVEVEVPGTLSAVVAYKEHAGLDYRLVWGVHDVRTDPFRLEPEVSGTVQLVLDGARPVEVAVRDGAGAPLAGAAVGLITVTKRWRGASLHGVFSALQCTTDGGGVARFDFFPREVQGPNHFHASLAGRAMDDLAVFDPDHPERPLVIRLVALVRLTGIVRDAAGAPVAGAIVHGSAARAHFVHKELRATTGADGAFAMEVPAERLCVLFARKEDRASLVHTRIVGETPVEPVGLILGVAPRLSGQVTAGPERTPLAQVEVEVEVEYGFNTSTLRGIHDMPGGDGPDEEGSFVHPRMTLDVTTDDAGRYDLHTAPGHYMVDCEMGQQRAWASAEVTLAENWLPLHFETVPSAPPMLTGRVVRADDPAAAVAYAWVLCHATRWTSMDAGSATADGDGCFTLPRPPAPFYLFAGSPDRRLVGLLEVTADETMVTLALGPAAEVSGRLVHPDGTPAAEVVLLCEAVFGDTHKRACTPMTFTAETNGEGGFAFAGLLPGMACTLQVLGRRAGGRVGPFSLTLRVEAAGVQELGDLKLAF